MKILKQATKDLKLPQSGAYGCNEINESYTWNKRCGSLGCKIISAAIKKALELGWKESTNTNNSDVTGNIINNGSILVSPDNKLVLFANAHIGNTSDDNRYMISLRLVK